MSSLTGGDEAEASDKSMVCPGTAKGLLTNNECKKSDFSKQNGKGGTEMNIYIL